MSSASNHSDASSLSSFTREAERRMYERNALIGRRGYATSPSLISSNSGEEYWGSELSTEVSQGEVDGRDTPLIHSPVPSQASQQSWRGVTPSRWQNQFHHFVEEFQMPAPPTPLTYASDSSSLPPIGVIRRRRGSIVPEEDYLRTIPEVNTRQRNFRFGGKTYLLTYSQIGDIPNSALEEKMANFGNQLKSEGFFFSYTYTNNNHNRLVWCRRASSRWRKALALSCPLLSKNKIKVPYLF
jgi:hypothetical protein